MLSSRDIANYSIGHSSGQAVNFSNNAAITLYSVHKNTFKAIIHSLNEQFLQQLQISENLVKNFNEVKRSLLIRISEFPFNMHNYRPI